jgi:hypothetical protein
LVRPFFAAESAKDAVGNAQIRLFETGDFKTETAYSLDEIDLSRLRPIVRPNLMPLSGWLPPKYRPRDFCLLVLAANTFLRRSIIVYKSRLDTECASEVSLSEAVIDDLGGGRTVDIEVAVCLEHSKSALVPGLPFLSGHWLSRKVFTVRERIVPWFFDVQPRTDEEWHAAGFPRKTFYAIDYLGGINTSPESNAKIATVYMHVDAYNALTSDDRRTGRLLQPILATELIAQILETSLDEWQSVDDVAPRSPLSTVLRKFAGLDKSIDLDRLKQLVQPIERPKLRALLQQHLSIVRTIIEA